MRRIVLSLLMLVVLPAMALEGPPALQFDVVRYEVTGANPLRPEVISKVLKPYLGRHYGLEGLSAAVNELERKLKKEGYSFHRVILLPQSLAQGIVKLKVVEFTLGKLKVKGQKYFSEANIRRSLPSLVEGKAPNTRILNQSLMVANDHPDKNLQMIFKEGEKPDTVDIDLLVADKSPHSTYILLNNTGTKETGESRFGIGYQYSNLFDKDHIVSMNYSTSLEESDKVSQYVLSYGIPFYKNGDQLSIYYSDSEVKTKDSLGSIDVDITGAGTVLGTRYMYSFKKVQGYRHKLYFGLDKKEFDNVILIQASQPVEAPGTNKLDDAPVSVEYEVSKSQIKTPFSFAVSYFHNLSGDADAYNQEARYPISVTPSTDWNLLRYRGQLDLPVSSSFFRFRINGQITSEPLISGEQFGIGGSQSVRGYDERVVLGDQGYNLNIEWWNTTDRKKIRWLVFYDTGEANYVDPLCDSCDDKQSLSSFGFGMRWLWKRSFNFAADFAQVQEDYDETKSGDTKLHVSMTYQF